MSYEIPPELLDALLDAYVDWREEFAHLDAAYERWSSVPIGERELAFAVFRAALDREEQACAVYSNRVATVEGEAAATTATWQ